ncbi:MAG: two-component regulator propeller domain-containing protein, partial [Eudoraea sp.]|nr:two-component regulator propeller domain-containing protein [Eudoraea sp.]
MLNNKPISIVFCLIILFCSGNLLQARETGEDSNQLFPQNIKFKHLTVENGLSSNNVAAVLQDAQGFLWIGTTSGGLNKYDGAEFTNYVNIQNDPESLSNNYTWRLSQDKKGIIWIVTWG